MNLEEMLNEGVTTLFDDVSDVVDEFNDTLEVVKITATTVVVKGLADQRAAKELANDIEKELEGVSTDIDKSSHGFVVKVTDDSETDEDEEFDPEAELAEMNAFHDTIGKFSDQERATSYSAGGEQAYFKSGKKVRMSEPGGRLARNQGKDNPIKRNTDKPLGSKGLRGQSSRSPGGSQTAFRATGQDRDASGNVKYGAGKLQGTSSREANALRGDITAKGVKSFAQHKKDTEDKAAKQYNQRLSAARKGGAATAAKRRAAKAQSESVNDYLTMVREFLLSESEVNTENPPLAEGIVGTERVNPKEILQYLAKGKPEWLAGRAKTVSAIKNMFDDVGPVVVNTLAKPFKMKSGKIAPAGSAVLIGDQKMAQNDEELRSNMKPGRIAFVIMNPTVESTESVIESDQNLRALKKDSAGGATFKIVRNSLTDKFDVVGSITHNVYGSSSERKTAVRLAYSLAYLIGDNADLDLSVEA